MPGHPPLPSQMLQLPNCGDGEEDDNDEGGGGSDQPTAPRAPSSVDHPPFFHPDSSSAPPSMVRLSGSDEETNPHLPLHFHLLPHTFSYDLDSPLGFDHHSSVVSGGSSSRRSSHFGSASGPGVESELERRGSSGAWVGMSLLDGAHAGARRSSRKRSGPELQWTKSLPSDSIPSRRSSLTPSSPNGSPSGGSGGASSPSGSSYRSGPRKGRRPSSSSSSAVSSSTIRPFDGSPSKGHIILPFGHGSFKGASGSGSHRKPSFSPQPVAWTSNVHASGSSSFASSSSSIASNSTPIFHFNSSFPHPSSPTRELKEYRFGSSSTGSGTSYYVPLTPEDYARRGSFVGRPPAESDENEEDDDDKDEELEADLARQRFQESLVRSGLVSVPMPLPSSPVRKQPSQFGSTSASPRDSLARRDSSIPPCEMVPPKPARSQKPPTPKRRSTASSWKEMGFDDDLEAESVAPEWAEATSWQASGNGVDAGLASLLGLSSPRSPASSSSSSSAVREGALSRRAARLTPSTTPATASPDPSSLLSLPPSSSSALPPSSSSTSSNLPPPVFTDSFPPRRPFLSPSCSTVPQSPSLQSSGLIVSTSSTGQSPSRLPYLLSRTSPPRSLSDSAVPRRPSLAEEVGADPTQPPLAASVAGGEDVQWDLDFVLGGFDGPGGGDFEPPEVSEGSYTSSAFEFGSPGSLGDDEGVDTFARFVQHNDPAFDRARQAWTLTRDDDGGATAPGPNGYAYPFPATGGYTYQPAYATSSFSSAISSASSSSAASAVGIPIGYHSSPLNNSMSNTASSSARPLVQQQQPVPGSSRCAYPLVRANRAPCPAWALKRRGRGWSILPLQGPTEEIRFGPKGKWRKAAGDVAAGLRKEERRNSGSRARKGSSERSSFAGPTGSTFAGKSGSNDRGTPPLWHEGNSSDGRRKLTRDDNGGLVQDPFDLPSSSFTEPVNASPHPSPKAMPRSLPPRSSMESAAPRPPLFSSATAKPNVAPFGVKKGGAGGKEIGGSKLAKRKGWLSTLLNAGQAFSGNSNFGLRLGGAGDESSANNAAATSASPSRASPSFEGDKGSYVPPWMSGPTFQTGSRAWGEHRNSNASGEGGLASKFRFKRRSISEGVSRRLSKEKGGMSGGEGESGLAAVRRRFGSGGLRSSMAETDDETDAEEMREGIAWEDVPPEALAMVIPLSSGQQLQQPPHVHDDDARLLSLISGKARAFGSTSTDDSADSDSHYRNYDTAWSSDSSQEVGASFPPLGGTGSFPTASPNKGKARALPSKRFDSPLTSLGTAPPPKMSLLVYFVPFDACKCTSGSKASVDVLPTSPSESLGTTPTGAKLFGAFAAQVKVPKLKKKGSQAFGKGSSPVGVIGPSLPQSFTPAYNGTLSTVNVHPGQTSSASSIFSGAGQSTASSVAGSPPGPLQRPILGPQARYLGGGRSQPWQSGGDDGLASTVSASTSASPALPRAHFAPLPGSTSAAVSSSAPPSSSPLPSSLSPVSSSAPPLPSFATMPGTGLTSAGSPMPTNPFHSFRIVARAVDPSNLTFLPSWPSWESQPTEHKLTTAAETKLSAPGTNPETQASQTRDARTDPTVVGVCHGPSLGVEFVREGWERLGFVKPLEGYGGERLMNRSGHEHDNPVVSAASTFAHADLLGAVGLEEGGFGEGGLENVLGCVVAACVAVMGR